MCGATRLLATHPRRRRSYPHIRGAYALTTLNHYVTWGLSPRVWGVRVYESSLIPYERAIPTCVGRTSSRAPRSVLGQSYPHVRGAYVTGYSAPAIMLELSPRAWGVQSVLSVGISGTRVIPTCVGLTSRTLLIVSAGWSYPHVRGEYAALILATVPGNELSPRAWGLPDGLRLPSSPSGAIPTCVGLTLCGADHATQRKSYPHVREAYVKKSRWIDAGIELSPRAWGVRRPPRAHQMGGGVIPTCVGLT